MSFADLIRSGNEQGLLLGTWPDWKRYRDMRATWAQAGYRNLQRQPARTQHDLRLVPAP